MSLFLNTADVQLMRRDFEDQLRGPDACAIILRYRTPQFPLESPTVDPVFGSKTQPVLDEVQSAPIRAIHHIVGKFDHRILAMGIVVEGDSIFYVSKSINLGSPLTDKPVVTGSLIVQDTAGVLWNPLVQENAGQAAVRMVYGTQNICQAIPCKLRKT